MYWSLQRIRAYLLVIGFTVNTQFVGKSVVVVLKVIG